MFLQRTCVVIVGEPELERLVQQTCNSEHVPSEKQAPASSFAPDLIANEQAGMGANAGARVVFLCTMGLRFVARGVRRTRVVLPKPARMEIQVVVAQAHVI